MKRCTACGVRNLDSDTYCFNCDEPLAVTGLGAPALDARAPAPALEAPVSRRQAGRQVTEAAPAAGFPSLFLSNLLTKLVLLIIALGLFFLVSIIAIWVAYDNLPLALTAFGVGGLGFLVSMIYPDIRTGLRSGSRGWWIALAADVIFLGITVFPVLYYLASKGYIAGVFDWLGRFFWTLAPVPLIGAFAASVAGLFSRSPN